MVRDIAAIAIALIAPTFVIADSSYQLGRYKTIVIEDRGGVSVRKYIPEVQSNQEWLQERYEERGKKAIRTSMYPVRTPSMKVGRVGRDEGKDIPRHAMATRQMFIIGDDPVSRDWLARNKDFLRAKRAVGLVVNVESKERMNVLKRIAGHGLLLQAMPGESLSRSMGIKHYPFYIDKDGIMR